MGGSREGDSGRDAALKAAAATPLTSFAVARDKLIPEGGGGEVAALPFPTPPPEEEAAAAAAAAAAPPTLKPK